MKIKMKLSLIVAIIVIAMMACSGKTSSDLDFVCTNPPATECPRHNVWAQVCSPWILTSPKVHLIFLGDWWMVDNQSQQSNQMAQEWEILANDPNFYLPAAQYG